MSEDLNDFFKLISEDKKKKKEEFNAVVGDLGLDSLFNEFAGLKRKQKEKKSKNKEPSIGNINLDSIFEEVSNLKKETKKKKVKEEKTVKAFEKWLYSDSEKEEEVINEVIEESLDEVLEVIEENKEELEELEKTEEKTFDDELPKVLTEIVNDESRNTTKSDKTFATLEDLDKHYKVFLSRIQQQLSSIGGGGEVRLEFLDDIDRDSAKVNGKFLKYDSVSNKWVGADASGGGGGGSQTLDNTLGLGNTSSLGMSVGVVTSTQIHIDPVGSGVTFNEDLVVVGDARVTGILSIGTSSIVFDPNTKTISGVEELQVGETTVKNDSEGNITFVNRLNPTQTINVGIGSTVSVNTIGIITASSFFGDGSGLTGIVASGSGVVIQNDGSNVGTASTINFDDNLSVQFNSGTATVSASIGYASSSGISSNANNLNNQPASYYLDYTNFTNTPTIPGRTGDLVNNSGFVTSGIVVGYATEGFVNSAVAGIVSSAPDTLDTLNELAQALGDDANFSTTVTNLIGTKASLSGAAFTGIVTAPSFSGAIELSSDTSPQLGGQLQSNGNSIKFADDDSAFFGTGFDFRIFHDGTNTNLKNIKGDLIIATYPYPEGGGDDVIIESADDFEVRLNTGTSTGSGTTAIYATGGGSVSLNHNGSTKFETTSTGVNVTGNIAVTGTVDGRNLVTDGNKLDNIASNATAYGDSDVDSHLNRTQQVSQNYVLSWDGQDYAWVAQSSGGISNVVEDLTPQLGGHLDLNGKSINGTGGANITGVVTATSFSGAIELSSDTSPQLGGQLDTNSNNIKFADNDEAIFGTNSDLRIDHDGTDNHITSSDTDLNIELNPDLSTPKIYIRPNTSHQGITLGGGSGNPVELYCYNSKKFETTDVGVTVSGNITVSGTVDGRDIATDGTKLDGIASNATAYSDSDVDSHLNRTQQVSQDYVLSWNGSDYAWVAQSGGGASEAFKTIAVSGQSDVVADSATDTLTLVAGSNMTITTSPNGDEITFASSGGGGGVTTGKAIAMAMIFG